MLNLLKSILAFTLLSVATSKKVYIDNDGLTAPIALIPLKHGWEIVGMSGSFGSASLVDSMGQISNILDVYNLSSCIPLYEGANQPLLRRKDTFKLWQTMFGDLVWQGAYDDHYQDMYTWDNVTYDQSVPAALALIDVVKKYKDEDPVYIYAAGMMTTVAQALSLYPSLVNDSAGLYIMGGFIDTQYAAATGTPIVNDINTDINFIDDPEAAQIVVTAGWKELVIGANVTNYLVPSQKLYDKLIDKAGGNLTKIRDTPYLSPLSTLLATGNYSQNNDQQTLPFWDEVVVAFLTDPSLILNSTNFSVAVDTQFYSPFYGSLRIWGNEFAPKGVKTGNATIVNQIDDDRFYNLILDVYLDEFRSYCSDGSITAYNISQEI
ncbi:hypothetical protein KGF54_002881 [Candida jiufengensis]|uniref:uncharacterized protein n=1 Tax=Candida jiufengensis TaxID=497108 RepID=UPI0022252EC4|nr:uncharacterized protein KGF54_002881 [Candida jiufengensis]KAI5953509.1 hypothetical protein KGF54_002881 [Candida jiufengensis]